VGGGKLKIDPSKIEVIVKWPEPKSVTEVRSFLGAVQYWRRFIPNFSFIAAPLHALTSVKNTFQWEGKQQKDFNILKEKIQYRTSISTVESSKAVQYQDRCQRIHHGCSIDAIS
jgi:hypothetical protein